MSRTVVSDSTPPRGITIKDPKTILVLALLAGAGGGTSLGAVAQNLLGAAQGNTAIETQLAEIKTELKYIRDAQQEMKATILAGQTDIAARVRDADALHKDLDKRLMNIEARQPQRR